MLKRYIIISLLFLNNFLYCSGPDNSEHDVISTLRSVNVELSTNLVEKNDKNTSIDIEATFDEQKQASENIPPKPSNCSKIKSHKQSLYTSLCSLACIAAIGTGIYAGIALKKSPEPACLEWMSFNSLPQKTICLTAEGSYPSWPNNCPNGIKTNCLKYNPDQYHKSEWDLEKDVYWNLGLTNGPCIKLIECTRNCTDDWFGEKVRIDRMCKKKSNLNYNLRQIQKNSFNQTHNIGRGRRGK